MENITVNEGKPAAIISYLWIIGLVIAFLINSNKKNTFSSFHIRQATGLIVIHLIIFALERFLGIGMLAWIFDVGLFILWVIAILGAIQGEEKKEYLCSVISFKNGLRALDKSLNNYTFESRKNNATFLFFIYAKIYIRLFS